MKIPFSYQTFSALLPNETTAIAYYTERHSTYCPGCNIRLTRPLRRRNPLLLRCPQCGKTVSVFTGTVFQGTRADLRYWLYTGMLFYFCKSHFPPVPATSSVVHKIHKAGGRSHLGSDHAPDIHDPQAAFR